MLASSRFVANSSLSYRAITGGNLTRGSKSRERLPPGYTYGRTGKELDQKEKNTLPSHTSSVDDSPSPCLSFFSPNYKCWVVLTFSWESSIPVFGAGFKNCPDSSSFFKFSYSGNRSSFQNLEKNLVRWFSRSAGLTEFQTPVFKGGFHKLVLIN
jgi:hypothetical protein